MTNNMPRENLISARYKNDGLPIMPLNHIQKRYLEAFKADGRIRYRQIKKCPICDYDNFTLIAEKDRYGISLETVVCDRCGLIFTRNQMTDEASRIFYAEYYRPIYGGTEDPDGGYLKERYNAQASGRIPGFLRGDSVIVEIGTGGGWNLLRFKRKGFKHYGFDLDEKYVNFGRERYGLNLYLGGLEEAKESGIKADYVILPHVLEHTSRPAEFLMAVKDIMKNEAILNISLPVADFLVLGGTTAGYDLLGTLQNAHNFLFDGFTLKYSAMKSGYGIKVNLGENMVLQKNEKTGGNLTESAVNKLNTQHRGVKIINYLKKCERLIPLKDRIKRIIGEKLFSNLMYLYYVARPLEVGRKYLMSGLGIII